ncbi:MAG TPA: hypothetical protein VFP58_05875 [Candidatus Eisenbacteria bacterium]|nr:hypothetical protein [Candidatus Eisenbacteria bacterium]
MTRRVGRPWQIYALTMLFALKGAEELFRGVVGTAFYVGIQSSKGILQGFGLQLAIQSILFSLLLAGASFYVMAALWLGRSSSRSWGVAVALVSEAVMLGFLISRPPEFGGRIPLVRTVIIASIVNLSIAAILIFDTKLSAFLGSTRLTGWWVPRPLRRREAEEVEGAEKDAER